MGKIILKQTQPDVQSGNKNEKSCLAKRLIGDMLFMEAKTNHTIMHAHIKSQIPLAVNGHKNLAAMISFCHA
jgi:hypothetical protein